MANFNWAESTRGRHGTSIEYIECPKELAALKSQVPLGCISYASIVEALVINNVIRCYPDSTLCVERTNNYYGMRRNEVGFNWKISPPRPKESLELVKWDVTISLDLSYNNTELLTSYTTIWEDADPTWKREQSHRRFDKWLKFKDASRASRDADMSDIFNFLGTDLFLEMNSKIFDLLSNIDRRADELSQKESEALFRKLKSEIVRGINQANDPDEAWTVLAPIMEKHFGIEIPFVVPTTIMTSEKQNVVLE